MLTQNQINSLAKVSDDKKVLVKPFNPLGLEIADHVMANIKAVEPDLEMAHMGSVALEIVGQEDIDINVFCIKEEQAKHKENFINIRFAQPFFGHALFHIDTTKALVQNRFGRQSAAKNINLARWITRASFF